LSGAPIKIGALVAQSGRTARQDGSSASVINAWASEVNETGGIGGRPVEVVLKDSKGDPAAATTVAQDFVADTSIVAVIGVDSVTESVYAPVLSTGGLPLVGGHGLNPSVWGKLPNVWLPTTTFPATVAPAVLASATIDDTKSVGSIVCAENSLCAQVGPLYEKAATNDGLRFDGLVTATFDAPSYTGECLQFAGKKTEAVSVALGGATVARLIKDCLTQNYEPIFSVNDGTVTEENFGLFDPKAKIVGSINGFPWFSDRPAVKRFVDVMENRGVDKNDWANSASTSTWASLELFRKAMTAPAEAANGAVIDRQAVIQAYGSVKSETLDGLASAPLTFTANAPMPANNCFWYYTWTDGVFSAFNDGNPSCMDPKLVQ
jgi:branched-chain amino acid transport system substrate-binding protein